MASPHPYRNSPGAHLSSTHALHCGHTCLYMRGRDVRLGGVVRGGGVLAIMLVHGQIYDVTYLKAGQATR